MSCRRINDSCWQVGLTGAALSAKEVVLSDQVLHVARHNRDANFSGAARARVKLAKLEWGSNADAAAIKPPFDVILGSDIL